MVKIQARIDLRLEHAIYSQGLFRDIHDTLPVGMSLFLVGLFEYAASTS